ncbi:hypothetical protein I350_06538 [Cryptococcus amylolentus CBS 6273]|uniref:RED-like N-terminal domain-containing protein n=1 Tax=Cryptococcus amylolentus CBS 6273 TaxID=1296118 RepID=A0A1E3JP73_9TREE|nr:hypothetical protein I350_06538 [Cryptococcus amylolentus CBS 6273]
MDQSAFRSLLNKPRPAGESSSSRRGVLGGAPPKRGWGLKAKEGQPISYEKKDEPPKESKPAFVPRQHLKKEQDSRYKDRAALRREGLNDDFKSVEKLLEDFEARKEHATVEELAEIEKQRVYLGGDAEHSVLVKGLDYALLAARRAELAREEGEEMDDELEAFQEQMKDKKPAKAKAGKGKEQEKPQEEGLGKGFKSIAQKKAEAEAAAAAPGDKKKKKKKKKVKTEPVSASVPDTTATSSSIPSKKATVEEPIKLPPKAPTPPPPESDDDDDIFGDAGEYDLAAAAGPVGSDSDSEDEQMDAEDGEISRGRSRSRSFSRDRSYSRDRSLSRNRGYGRDLGPRSPGSRHSRSHSRSRERSRYRSRSSSRDYQRRYSRSPSYDRYDRRRSPSPPRRRNRSPSYSRSRSPYGGDHKRRRMSYSRSPPRRRYDSRSRSPRRRYSPSPRPRGRSYSYSRSPSPPPRRARSRTRSLSPLLNAPLLDRSRSPTPSSDEDGPSTRLQPLASSAIPSLKSFLAADEADAKAAEKRANKAKWRAHQGMSMQEGAEEDTAAAKQKTMNEKQKSNREYQLLMNKMKKDEEREGKEGKK